MSSADSKTNKSFSFTRNRDVVNETDLQRLQIDVDSYTRYLEQEKRYIIFLLMKRILRRLFTVEETYQVVLKEYKEWAKKTEKIGTPVKGNHRQMAVKIHSLEKQLEQVSPKKLLIHLEVNCE